MKNFTLLTTVTSNDFVALLIAILQFNYGEDTGPEISNVDLWAHLLTIESFSLPELLELLSDVELPLLTLAKHNGIFNKIKDEYIRLTLFLHDTIENSTGEEA